MRELLHLCFGFPPKKWVSPLATQRKELPPVSSVYPEGRGTLPSSPHQNLPSHIHSADPLRKMERLPPNSVKTERWGKAKSTLSEA